MVDSIEKGFKGGKEFAAALGCTGANVAACLRQKTAAEILAVDKGASVSTSHVDGYVLTDKPIELIKAGEYNQVPVIVGSNKDEIKIMLFLGGINYVPGFLITKAMKDALGPRYDQMRALYPGREHKKPRDFLAVLGSDGFGSRGFDAAEALSARTPVYYYRFDWDEEILGKQMGAFHGLEIPFVFGNLELDPKRSGIGLLFNKKAVKRGRPLSDSMMDYWSNFARTGDPNGSDAPEWPRYDATTRARILLDRQITSAPLTAIEIERYQYFAAIGMDELGPALSAAR